MIPGYVALAHHNHMNRLICLALFCLLSATGCAKLLYRQTVPQGNLLAQADIDTIAPGMTKRQVALILGTPAVQSAFNTDRWDYVYSYQASDKTRQVKTFAVFFTDDAVARLSGDFKPGGSEVVFKPEDTIIEATKEYQRALREAEKERARPAGGR